MLAKMSLVTMLMARIWVLCIFSLFIILVPIFLRSSYS